VDASVGRDTWGRVARGSGMGGDRLGMGWSHGHGECGGGCAGFGCGCAGCGGWGGGAWVLGLRSVFEMVWGCVVLDLGIGDSSWSIYRD